MDPDDTAPQERLTPELLAALSAEHHHHAREGHAHAAPGPTRVTSEGAYAVHAVPEHAAPGGHVPHEPPRHVDARRPVPRRALVAGAVAGALLVVGGAGAWALSRDGAAPATGATASATATPSGTLSDPSLDPSAAPGITGVPMLEPGQDTLVLGDSLGLTVYPYLADLVPDRYVSYEAEVGRTTAGTLTALRRSGSVPPVVLVSSGTNDATAADLERDATAILDRLGSARCVVWADVVRPDGDYASASELNAALDRAVAGRTNVSVLRWSQLVAEHPDWIGGDGIHANEAGARGRAAAFAAASESCSAFDPSAPRAKKQYLPLSAFYGPLAGGSTAGSGSSTTPRPSASRSASASQDPAPAPSPTEQPTGSSTPSTTASTTAPPSPSATSPSTDPPPVAATP